MSYNIDTGFSNDETLKNIREGVLNPLASRTANLLIRTTEVEKVTKVALTNPIPDVPNQAIRFTVDGQDTNLSLKGMFREGSDLAVADKDGRVTNAVSKITFEEATVADAGNKSVEVKYDWKTIVPANQTNLSIGKTGSGAVSAPKALYFKGTGIQVEATSADITTVTIPDAAGMTGQIGSASSKAIDGIQLIGNVGGSTFEGTTLKIQLPEAGGGGGGGITNQNFKGFFETLGDIESQISDPENGKSYAFAKDSKLGGAYYTPYFYVNSAWTELKQDPALVYSGPTETQTHGVFSIKPDARITVDNTGQIDLSGLAIPPEVNFHGFFPTVAELKKAVTNPVRSKSFAYVQHIAGSWVGMVWKGDTDQWSPVIPIGSTILKTTSSSSEIISPIMGFNKNAAIEVDDKGMATIIPPSDKHVQVDIIGSTGQVTTLDMNHISFINGSRYVSKAAGDERHIEILPSQQAHTFTAKPDDQFNPSEHEAAIFYDNTTQTWMGCSGKPLASGQHWSRIIHENMSDEVKSITSRFPEQIKEFTPSALGDGPAWRVTGWTYVQAQDTQLPSEFGDKVGGYFLTMVQDSTVAIPLERLQFCYADDDSGRFYFRQFESTGSAGAAQGWKKWTKGAINVQDLKDHNEDPGAHSLSHKFYKVGTLDMSWKALKAKNGIIGDNDLLLLSDSHGSSINGEATINVPYTGSYQFSGRIDFDGWGTGSTYQKPMFIIYVYKTVGSTATIVSESSYTHTDHTKIIPPLQWKSGDVALNVGDKIHFEIKVFNTNLETSYPDLRFIPNRTFFVMEDSRTKTGTRIAETFRRTMGSLNAHYNVGVNVHYNAGTSGAVRVYGSAVTAQATHMTKVKK